jgi:hypothetical protein
LEKAKSHNYHQKRKDKKNYNFSLGFCLLAEESVVPCHPPQSGQKVTKEKLLLKIINTWSTSQSRGPDREQQNSAQEQKS